MACLMSTSSFAISDNGIDMKCVPLTVSIAVVSRISPLPKLFYSFFLFIFLNTLFQQHHISFAQFDQRGRARKYSYLQRGIGSVDQNVLFCQGMIMVMPSWLFEAMQVAKEAAKTLLLFMRISIEEHSRRVLREKQFADITQACVVETSQKGAKSVFDDMR